MTSGYGKSEAALKVCWTTVGQQSANSFLGELFFTFSQVTMVALVLDDNKTNDDGERQKNNMIILTNNNFARALRYFVHFFAVIAPLRNETS